jgi:putative endonuclease
MKIVFMFFVYILESIDSGRWYIGSTADIDERISRHNSRRVKSSKPYRPYRLIYSETYSSLSAARKREVQIKKSGVIRKELKARLNHDLD